MAITVTLTRIVRDGHLSYRLQGDFSCIPVGNLVEKRIRDFFLRITTPANSTEGNFFRLVDRDQHCSLHVKLYNQTYSSAKAGIRKDAPGRDIKFIDLMSPDVLFSNLKSPEKNGHKGMQQEFIEIQKIIQSVENSEETLSVELTS
jgi:hypothetical protein